ncbi:leucine-rich repeat-containing protein 14-like [Haliotis rufescens]|uniref:leucine-rich repeat-containing protein 14-like n=1 Tax=Haliotis rufescens TaxID=6454 RepID=UPI001EB08682|nr:leucine-rich repeat-containing protein 14-like [Haliotis rufescens]
MSLTDVMEDVDYKRKNFNRDDVLYRHPLHMTEAHFVYHLSRDPEGHLTCNKDGNGEFICSPRHLKQLCMHRLVINPARMQKFKYHELPHDIYPALLSEAIFQRELQAITFFVSTWPHKVLDIQSIVPQEDILRSGYLTRPVEGQGSMSLVDSVIMGLLNIKPHAKLQTVNFIGFKNDRKLCRELTRLPMLWLNPSDRQAGYIHSLLRRSINLSKDKVQRYLNRIGCIYSLLDPCFRHGNKIGPITILIDCKITLDDVPIGLALQYETPFRFACKRLWMEPILEVVLPPNVINRVLDPRHITHFELTDENLCSDLTKFDLVLEGLLLLPGLQALSLHNSLHTNLHGNAAYELNQTLQQMNQLRKLNFSSCTLRDNLDTLLSNLAMPLIYLNLRDCRLTTMDMQFLYQWQPIEGLQELNLSRNNLKAVALLTVGFLQKMPKIACFSVSYCCFSPIALKQVTRRCVDCSHLKIIGLQAFTPPPLPDLREMLEDCANIPTLQRCSLLPEAYAFPGCNEVMRAANREGILNICCQLLDEMGRTDIELE